MKFLTSTSLLLASILAAPGLCVYTVKTDGLHCRKGPSTSDAIVKSYAQGTVINIQCQTTGTKVETTNVWDKTQDNCYVTDYYVKTGHASFIPGVPRCGGGGGGSGGSGSPCTTVNSRTISLIKEFEGFVPSPSPDPIGLPTVGYGHLCQTRSCSEAGPFPLSKAQATALLNRDLRTFTRCINNMVRASVTLNDNQFGALVSWSYNVGCGNAESSTLIRRLNNGENPNTVAAEELPKWVFAGGRRMPGLVNRRHAEVQLFQTPSSHEAHPNCT